MGEEGGAAAGQRSALEFIYQEVVKTLIIWFRNLDGRPYVPTISPFSGHSKKGYS